MVRVAIEGSLATCKAHLDNIPTSDLAKPEIESQLVASLIVLIVSEYEVLIRDLFRQRIALCRDQHVCNYFEKSTFRRTFTSPDVKKITTILAMFGGNYQQQFLSAVRPHESAAWDSIVYERHAVVHKSSTRQMTLRELMSTYPLSWKIIGALKQTLGLP
jgi:hypothetical protein